MQESLGLELAIHMGLDVLVKWLLNDINQSMKFIVFSGLNGDFAFWKMVESNPLSQKPLDSKNGF